MSHFTEVKTHIKNEFILKKVLQTAGFQIEESQEGVGVRGFMGETQNADFKIFTKTHYDIGFRKNSENAFELIGDWELMPQVADIEQASFTSWLKREYARESILSTAQEQGYSVEEVEGQNGQIQLTVSKW